MSPYVKLLTIPLFMLHCPYTNVMGNDKPGEYMKMAFVQSVAHVIQEPSGYLMRCFTTEETQGILPENTGVVFNVFRDGARETLRSKEGKK